MTLTITLQTVGVVRSDMTDMEDERDWSEIESDIVVDEAFAAGLKGIEEYVDIVVVFYLHKFRFDLATDLQQHPPKRDDLPPVGIFALRTPQRPNAIGATTVRLLSVRDNVLRVKGLDAFDGSPVLDIKPYAPTVKRATLELPEVEPEI